MKLYACLLFIIDGLGHVTWSLTMLVHISFQALVGLELLVSLISRFGACSVRISGDRQTHTDTQTKYHNPRHAH